MGDADTCRTAQAFKRRLGVLGVNLQAERMLHAFVSSGLELRLQEIKYHAQGKDNEVESLTGICSKDSDDEASHKHILLLTVTRKLWCISKPSACMRGVQGRRCNVARM